ncbi:MAG: immunity 17 family protein [Oscillospiraceae bacterium]|nr:immunity 17 family protein [Oscillospiraceae bacterium]
MGASSIMLLLIGAFFLIPSWRDWDWFFDSRRLRLITELLGRENARLTYMILGGAMMGAGLIMALAY